jgi:hypothetical protein
MTSPGLTGFSSRWPSAPWIGSSAWSGSARGITTPRRGCSPAAWPWPAVLRTGTACSFRCTTWRWPGRPRATRPPRPDTCGEGLALAAQAGDETSAAYYLEVLAGIAGAQDNPQRAVRLFAAARSILDARGSGWLHAFVPRVPPDDAALAALRSRIGDTAFEQAQAWGRSAGSTRAVEYALQQA